MIVTYIRSSSYNTHEWCAHKYFLEFCMGIPTLSGKKADKGNITHKALELLARQKQCQQRGIEGYQDEIFGYIKVSDINLYWATDKAYTYYADITPHHTWYEYDYWDCLKWTEKALNLNKAMFDPRNHHVIEAEQKFDFVINHPWAHYKYNHNNEIIEGQLALKGTIDLIIEDTPGLIEIIDWKTGQRKDWAKDGPEKKTYGELRYDPQLCLYHYAAFHLFPEAEEIFITIVFINDGGPYTLCFDKTDLEYTEQIIRKKFEEIRDTEIPKLNITWRCTKFCHFGMNPSKEDPSKTICQFYHDNVRKLGIEETIKQYGKSEAWSRYLSGGGRQSPD